MIRSARVGSHTYSRLRILGRKSAPTSRPAAAHSNEAVKTAEDTKYWTVDRLKALYNLTPYEQRALSARLSMPPGCEQLPYAADVGHVDRGIMHDGREVTLVYPKQPFVKYRMNYRRGFSGDGKSFRLPSAFIQGIPGMIDEEISGLEYFTEDGLRFVKPYYQVFDAQVPGRFIERGNPDLLSFLRYQVPFQNVATMRYAIERGHVMVNYKPVADSDPEKVIVKIGDHVSRVCHIHETPVLDEPVEVIYEDASMIVVNKPASYLVYPSGSTRLNSVTFTLKKERGLKDARTVHRLDRYTSGVLIIAKDPTSSARLKTAITSPSSRKTYLALVDGRFPDGEVVCDKEIEGHASGPESEKEYAAPKKALTKFRLMKTDGRVSLVECKLGTGRTHQIRLHLAALGHHIVNDNIYNPRDKVTFMRHYIEDSVFDEAIERMRKRSQSWTSAAAFIPDQQIPEAQWLENISQRLGYCQERMDGEMPVVVN